MPFDFAARPPEISSALMYSGSGAGPMMAAAAAWNNLAAELSTTAAGYESVIAELSGGEWTGPASAAMAAAAIPYVEWMNSAAAATERAASQVTASAAAYQTAFALTVPPAEVAANRAQLAALVATNVLGQNTPAIAATEVQYGEMWAQDATAMYGYTAAAASAATLDPLTSPAPTTNPAGSAGQAAAVSTSNAAATQSPLSELLSDLYNAIVGSPTSTAPSTNGVLSGPDGFFNDLISSGGNVGYLNDAFDVSGSFNGFDSMAFGGLFSSGGSASAAAGAASVTPAGVVAGARTAMPGAVGPAGFAGGGGAPVLAGLGQASSVAKLSVPASWPGPAAGVGTTVLEGSGLNVLPDSAPVTTVPAGMPAMASAGRGGLSFSAPRYGVKPTVMQRPIGVG